MCNLQKSGKRLSVSPVSGSASNTAGTNPKQNSGSVRQPLLSPLRAIPDSTSPISTNARSVVGAVPLKRQGNSLAWKN